MTTPGWSRLPPPPCPPRPPRPPPRLLPPPPACPLPSVPALLCRPASVSPAACCDSQLPVEFTEKTRAQATEVLVSYEKWTSFEGHTAAASNCYMCN